MGETSNRRNRKHILIFLFLLILSIRFVGIIATNLFDFNPFAHGQVQAHEKGAAEIAKMFINLEFNIDLQTLDRWRLLLSPFWLLPGPSELYAQMIIAVVGSVAILNVYLICEYYHSKQSGIIAILPLAFSPSYVLMHSVVQREAMVLFGLTSAFVLVFLPNKYVSSPYNYVLATLALFIPGYLRFPNAPVIIAVVVTTIVVIFLRSDRISFERKLYATMGLSITGVVSVIFIVTKLLTDQPVKYLANIRARRIRGRASYLEGVVPETIPELIAFSWLGAVYFLFTPFPWHVEGINDFVIMIESMIGLGFSIFAILGALVLKEKSLSATVALILGIVIFSVLYGFGTGNYGTGLRHRQVIFWAIFVLGAIGISSKFQFKI